jgi:hypothetical protein
LLKAPKLRIVKRDEPTGAENSHLSVADRARGRLLAIAG